MNWPHAPLYAILDTGYTSPENWVASCRALLSGGAGILQVRAKKESPADRARLARLVAPICQEFAVPLIINDDLPLALSIQGAGLHIGQDDTPVSEARAALGPHRILGLSTHSLEQARRALELPDGLLNYFATGPVFPTQTKPDYIPVGLQLVSDVARLRREMGKSALPWYCIGGINRRTLPQVLVAGAERVVIVSDLLLADNVECATSDTLKMLRAAASL